MVAKATAVDLLCVRRVDDGFLGVQSAGVIRIVAPITIPSSLVSAALSDG